MSHVLNPSDYYDEEYIGEYFIDEIVDGLTVYMAPSPGGNHSRATLGIQKILSDYFWDKKCEIFSELDVYLDKDTKFRPDIVVLCDESKLIGGYIHGAPDIVIEVLSPGTRRRDRGIKKDSYGRAGVLEYWLIEPNTLSVEVYHQKDGELKLFDTYVLLKKIEIAGLIEKDRISYTTIFKTDLFEDLEIDLKEIFHRIIRGSEEY